MTAIIISLIAIVLVIVIGAKTKTNIGLWALAAAYVIGVYVIKLKPADIITAFPVKVFLMLFSVTLFYGFAALNGSLERTALKVVYGVRNAPWSIPIVLYVLAYLLAGIGAGDGATVMLIPIAMSIAKITNMSYYLAATSVLAGISSGGFTPISTVGIFMRGLIEQVEKAAPEVAGQYANHAWFQVTLLFLIVFIAAYVVFKGYRVKAPEMEKPGPYEPKQKINLIIIAAFVAVMLLIPLLKLLLPSSGLFKTLNAGLNLTFVAFIAALAATIFKVADEKKAFQRVPLAALTTLTGMGTLIGIVSQSGAIKMVSTWLSQSVAPGLVPVMLAVCAGVMSLFVSGFVVNTTFFALVPILAAGAGVVPGFLYAAVAVGAMSTAVSPFSGSGGLVVASVDDDDNRKKIFNYLLVLPFCNLVIYLIMVALRIY